MIPLSDHNHTQLLSDSLKSCFGVSLCSELPNYGVILPALLKHGVEELPNHCKLTPGRLTGIKCLAVVADLLVRV